MAIVKIKDKFQVTLPGSLRQQAGLAVGDFLEAKLEQGNITLVPKRLVDRRIEESLRDYGKGRFAGPFSSPEETIRSLRRSRKKSRKR